jgi:hypothetical protein
MVHIGAAFIAQGVSPCSSRMSRAAGTIGTSNAKGIIVMFVEPNGAIDPRVFGDVRLNELAFAGARLTEYAVNS